MAEIAIPALHRVVPIYTNALVSHCNQPKHVVRPN